MNGKFHVLILWSWNGWTEFSTDTPWPDLYGEYKVGDVKEVSGDFKPWTRRYLTSRDDIIIIDMPSGTLD